MSPFGLGEEMIAVTYMKLAGLAAVAALLLTMLLGGTASATVLCKTNTNPCTPDAYGVGTVSESALKAGTKSVLKTGVATVECSESTLGVQETNGGGPTSEVVGSVSTLTFGSCSCPVTVLSKGTVKVAWTSGTNNGNVTSEGTEVRAVCGGITCNYGGTVKENFTLQGGEGAVWKVAEAVLNKQAGSGFLCSATAKWSAEYAVSSPSPLDVEETLQDPGVAAPANLSFKGGKAGDKKLIKVENVGPNNVLAVLGEKAGAHLIEEGGKQAEGNFKIIAGGTCQIPGEELNKGESCTVQIEFVSGAAGQTATYTLRYGNRLAPEALVASMMVES